MIKIIKEESSSRFVIMGVTDTGSKVYYNAEEDHLTTDILDATVYSERDIAVDDWNMLTNYGKKLPSGIRRLFVPLYNPEIMTESKESYLDKFRSMITDDGTLDRMVKIGNKLKIDTSKDPSESDAKKLIDAYRKEYGREIYRESKSTSGLNQKLSGVCSKYGYQLNDAFWDKNLLYVDIRPVSEYASNISVNKDKRRYGTDEVVVIVQTTAYGSLSSEEYAKFVGQINNTNELVKYLNQFDFDKELEHI